MTSTAKLRLIGLCFLAAFPLYGGGQSLIGGANTEIGLLLCLLNSVAVITIGVLLRHFISHAVTGNIYLTARIAEGVLLAIGLLTIYRDTPILGLSHAHYYQLAMLALGLGSLSMCFWLIRSKFCARWLAALAFVGYVCLTTAMAFEIFAMPDIAMYFLVPGAAFEIIFGGWLLFHRDGTYFAQYLSKSNK